MQSFWIIGFALMALACALQQFHIGYVNRRSDAWMKLAKERYETLISAGWTKIHGALWKPPVNELAKELWPRVFLAEDNCERLTQKIARAERANETFVEARQELIAHIWGHPPLNRTMKDVADFVTELRQELAKANHDKVMLTEYARRLSEDRHARPANVQSNVPAVLWEEAASV